MVFCDFQPGMIHVDVCFILGDGDDGAEGRANGPEDDCSFVGIQRGAFAFIDAGWDVECLVEGFLESVHAEFAGNAKTKEARDIFFGGI